MNGFGNSRPMETKKVSRRRGQPVPCQSSGNKRGKSISGKIRRHHSLLYHPGERWYFNKLVPCQGFERIPQGRPVTKKMPYTPIIGTLGYILSADRRKTLLVHRNSRPGDLHLGKFNGLGGKMHPDEDVIGCLRREIREEAGLEIDGIVLRGTINWTGFGANGENWLGFIFRIDKFSGRCFDRNPEGTLNWYPGGTAAGAAHVGRGPVFSAAGL